MGPSNMNVFFFYNTHNGEEVNAMFELLFWRKHRHSGVYDFMLGLGEGVRGSNPVLTMLGLLTPLLTLLTFMNRR